MKPWLKASRPAGQPISLSSLAEMPPIAVSLGSTLSNKTGSWRYIRPFYQDKTSPCNHACPAGSDVVRYIAALRDGNIEAAWRTLVAENPLPGVCGRVCPHPCETECNRDAFGGAITIRALERHLADQAAAHGWRPAKTTAEQRQPVSIIGSGPAGLSCAYHLARLGYSPVVYEAENEVGGLLRHAIPAYRLPKDVLDHEIANIESLGVHFTLNKRLGDNLSLHELANSGVVFLAIGQGLSRPLEIPGEETGGVLAGLEFLRRVARGQQVRLGRHVVVVGGGNTAMDAARTAIRLGASVTVLYRRTEAQMPAIAEEVEEARAEGVQFLFLAAPAKVLAEGEQVVGLRCLRMRLGEPDATGRERPIPVPGSEFDITANTVIAATGQELDTGVLDPSIHLHEGRILISEAGVTALTGVFAGGDAASGEGTVAGAIGSGKRVALAIDRYLRTGRIEGFPSLGETMHAQEREISKTVVRVDDLNPDYIEALPRPALEQRPALERQCDLAEVNLGLPAEVAAAEAARCISCGTCTSCDTCLLFCPDVAISRAAPGCYTIDYDYCKGCGVCAEECPRNVVSMEEEGL